MEIVELCESFTSCVSPCLYFDHPCQVGLGNRTLFVWGSAGQCVGGIDEFDSSTSLFKCEHGHGEGVNSPENRVKPVLASTTVRGCCQLLSPVHKEVWCG